MSFQQSVSGINAAAKALDAVSNNVANAATVGFKGSGAEFADIFAASVDGGGEGQIGIGTTLSSVKQSFTQGNIKVTNNPLDVAINGGGFFRMSTDGAITYTRNGQFLVDKDGFIVNSVGSNLTGFQANDEGIIVPSSPVNLVINQADLVPSATTSGEISLNLDSREALPAFTPFSVNDPLTYNSSTAMTLYDSLGNSHVMNLYFVKTATANTWELHASLDNVDVAATPGDPVGNIIFDNNGNLDPATANPMNILSAYPLATGAAPLTLDMNITGMTQFGSTFGVNKLSQDGYTSGRLSGLAISADGIIQGRYSNGQTRNMGQIAMANFANPNGLQALGGNQWSETAASGQPTIGAPNTGNLGAIQSAAVEESNIDLTAELVNMITVQRNYQANAQSIKTQDATMQTIVNLR